MALTTKQQAGDVVQAIVREYYNVRFPKMDEKELREAAFVTQPGSGALVYVLSDNGIQ